MAARLSALCTCHALLFRHYFSTSGTQVHRNGVLMETNTSVNTAQHDVAIQQLRVYISSGPHSTIHPMCSGRSWLSECFDLHFSCNLWISGKSVYCLKQHFRNFFVVWFVFK
jgi:hypothetical protein